MVFGNKGQTYDEIISRLIDVAEKSEFLKEQRTILATEKFVSIDEV